MGGESSNLRMNFFKKNIKLKSVRYSHVFNFKNVIHTGDFDLKTVGLTYGFNVLNFFYFFKNVIQDHYKKFGN